MITQTFEIRINADAETGVRIEPDHTNDAINRFKIYALAELEILDEENLDRGIITVDGYLGTIIVNSLRNFTFDGEGILSGNDLHLIADEIVKRASNLNREQLTQSTRN